MGERGQVLGGMPSDDPLHSLVVDRVERADGRYLLYYRWPEADSPALPPEATSQQGAQDDDV